ncbi:DUF6119 family protein [Caproicibacter sp.]|uniref:DUF6119 family protein n=1 Tax=Caproicibacter sp. TaxID=2814884 RepID=UPI0039895701
MPNYNIFKVDPELRIGMLQKFQEVGLTETYHEDIDGYVHSFYFSDEPIEAQIEWIRLYSSFVNLDEEPSNKSYFAVLLIQVPEGGEYAISLGKAHFYLSPFCYYDFGLQLAERIFQRSRMKQAKHFSSRRSKTITSYTRNNELSYESGESIGLIKGSTDAHETWGKSVTFGQSVKLSIPHIPEEVYLILDEIEAAMELPPRIQLPRAKVIKDAAEIRRLDSLLCQSLRENSVSVDIDEFSLNSVFFTFTDEYDGFAMQIKTKIGEQEFVEKASKEDSISKETVGHFLSNISGKGISVVDDIDRVKVGLWKDGKRRLTQPIKELVEYVTDDWCCLIGGRWMKFSQDYVAYLKDKIDSVQLNRDAPVILKKYSQTQQRQYGVVNQEEQTLIDMMEQRGHIVLHKSSADEEGVRGFNVEIADMKKDDCLYFVKMGTPQKLIYVIDQSLTTVSLIQNKRLSQDESVHGVTTICLWLIFDERKSDLTKLSEVSSITFLIAMNDWIQAVHDAGYNPAVNIGYRRFAKVEESAI